MRPLQAWITQAVYLQVVLNEVYGKKKNTSLGCKHPGECDQGHMSASWTDFTAPLAILMTQIKEQIESQNWGVTWQEVSG